MSYSPTKIDANRSPRDYRARILLIEDQSLIGIDLALTLQSLGYDVAGPCRTVAEAAAVNGQIHPDIAVLDIDLGEDGNSFDLARRLRNDVVSCIFVSGYSEKACPTPADLKDVPRLRKPVETTDLLQVIEQMIDS